MDVDTQIRSSISRDDGWGAQGGASKSNRQAYQRSVDILAVVWRKKQSSREEYAGDLMFGLELWRWQLEFVEVEAIVWNVKLWVVVEQAGDGDGFDCVERLARWSQGSL